MEAALLRQYIYTFLNRFHTKLMSIKLIRYGVLSVLYILQIYQFNLGDVYFSKINWSMLFHGTLNIPGEMVY